MKNVKLHRVSRLGLANKKRTNLDIQNNKLVGDRYDFLPVVKINKSEEPKNAIISLKECATHKKSKINLGSDYDKKHREYIIADIIIAKNSTARIPLMVKRGYDPWGFQDGDGILEFKSSNGSVKMNFINNDDTDYKEGEDKYDLKDAEYGNELVLEINAKKLARGTSFSISAYASDDNSDGFSTKSNRKGICGKFNLKVVEKDVFMKDEHKKIIEELKYIKPFADAHSPIEYDGNYCMAAAERSLSELLDNSKTFYSVERKTHTRKNKVSFANLTADDREQKFKSYVNSEIKLTTRDFKIILNKTFKIVDGKYKDRETKIKTRTPNRIYKLFLSNIRNALGYHIYYCSIAGANHTMILIIDNTNPCDSKFEFWDQHGLSSSTGKLENIANGVDGNTGINAQVQWLVRWLRGNKKDKNDPNADTFYPKLYCNFYKIKRL